MSISISMRISMSISMRVKCNYNNLYYYYYNYFLLSIKAQTKLLFIVILPDPSYQVIRAVHFRIHIALRGV